MGSLAIGIRRTIVVSLFSVVAASLVVAEVVKAACEFGCSAVETEIANVRVAYPNSPVYSYTHWSSSIAIRGFWNPGDLDDGWPQNYHDNQFWIGDSTLECPLLDYRNYQFDMLAATVPHPGDGTAQRMPVDCDGPAPSGN